MHLHSNSGEEIQKVVHHWKQYSLICNSNLPEIVITDGLMRNPNR